MADLDLLILGGGCAGLGLGMRLAEAGADAPRTRVLESRTRYEDDRTWCFWRTAPHRFEPLIAASWDAMAVGRGGVLRRHDCSETPYQMLPALPYYELAQERMGGSDRVRLDLGTRVTAEPTREKGTWVVETDRGTVRSRHLVDTRPPSPLPGCVLWQSFLGRVVRAEEARFDPTTATLMDFDEPDPRGVQFTYVLPFSPHEALVETTVFGARALGPSDLEADLERALDRRLGGSAATTLRSERGALPMGFQTPAPPTAWVQAGLFHGGARPSTGYAFQRIQAWAEGCAQAVLAGGAPRPAPPDPALRRGMDAVFLRVLRSEPERGPELLARLFDAAPTHRVVRFLSDLGSTSDALAIVRALPPGPFLREAGAALLRRPLGEAG
ncbi:lycopene cyclase family protein [Planctomycetota bacterium]|nr:lycopene cyclase family protein [Planctomycetota bacterium]